MMEYVISCVWSTLEGLCISFFNGAFLSKRAVNKQSYLEIVAVWVFVCIYANMPINHFVKQILTVTSYTILSIILYQGTFFVHVCLTIVCYVFAATADVIVVNGMCYLLGISIDALVWRKLSYVTLITADKLLVVFLAWILNHFRKKGGLWKQRSRWMQLSILFPAVSAIMLTILFYTAPREEDVPLSTVVFAGILVIANVAMLYVISSIEKATEQEQNFRMLLQQISLQTKNYHALEESYSLQRKATHEFQRHMRVIQGLLDQKEYETAQNYVSRLQNDRTLKIFSIRSKNTVIDVVLNKMYQMAEENGIKMHIKVNDLSSVVLNADELVVLLSNLLDNAMEACMKMAGDKEIVCSILKEDMIYLAIRNTSLPVNIVDGEILTTKDSPIEHGYGLPAVKYILNNLKAEYTFTYEDGWFQFAAEIPG